MKRVFLIVGVSTVLLLGFGWIVASYGKLVAGPREEPNSKYHVTIDSFNFVPASLTVPAGSKVTWVNHDDVPHTAVSNEKKFSSSVLDTDEQFSYSFIDPGTYEYYCSLHPKMTAKVIVQKREK